MLSPKLLRLVLLVSCAHALVHIYELALPSVDLRLSPDYGIDKQTFGLLSSVWRLPFGLGGLLAGWLVDRWGPRHMLAVFLLGSAACCVLLLFSVPLGTLFGLMFSMGCFASIYHPAGLALISYETDAANRTRSLGWHGIFGSAGIGLAPFLAGLWFSLGGTWRQYYLILALPGMLLGTLFWIQAVRLRESAGGPSRSADPEDNQLDLVAMAILSVLAFLVGFIYSATLSFLPRYLSTWTPTFLNLSAASRGNYLSSGVLLVGCVGQYLSGRFARPDRLERQLKWITLSTSPLLLSMALATPAWRPAAAATFALVHFMHQPIYNSLIAQYTPRARRSLAYGVSFAVVFGVGSLGATFAGSVSSDQLLFACLSGVALLAAAVGWRLERWQASRSVSGGGNEERESEIRANPRP